MLHLVRSSAFQQDDFSQCLNVIQPQDTLVLLDDGCYNLTHPLWQTAQEKLTRSSLCIISNHAQARAISTCDEMITEISLADLVTLFTTCNSVVTWQ